MATRVQSLILGLSTNKQTSISTAQSSTNMVRFKKLNTSLTSPSYVTETDAAEIGKGNEFISQVFPSHMNVANTLEKYGSSEWVTWATAYGLGNVTMTGSTAPYSYTITPINPGTTLELPYFTEVEQVAEGGGNAVDNMFVGCAIEEFTYAFNYGPGRASSKMTASFVGSGLLTTPSGITVPAVTTENNMLAGTMALTVNGVDYVGTGRILSGHIAWKNNLLLNQGFYPGSGVNTAGFQTRGRMEIGTRSLAFNFVVRAVHGSTEYTTLMNQSTGTAVLTVQHDANNEVTFTLQQVTFEAVELGEVDGLVTFNITSAPMYNATNGLITVTTKTDLGNIAQ